MSFQIVPSVSQGCRHSSLLPSYIIFLSIYLTTPFFLFRFTFSPFLSFSHILFSTCSPFLPCSVYAPFCAPIFLSLPFQAGDDYTIRKKPPGGARDISIFYRCCCVVALIRRVFQPLRRIPRPASRTTAPCGLSLSACSTAFVLSTHTSSAPSPSVIHNQTAPAAFSLFFLPLFLSPIFPLSYLFPHFPIDSHRTFAPLHHDFIFYNRRTTKDLVHFYKTLLPVHSISFHRTVPGYSRQSSVPLAH